MIAAVRRRPIIVAFAGVVLAALALGGCGCSPDSRPLARRGVLDLSAVDLEKDGPVGLDGEWEFYWNRLVRPDEFRSATPPAPSGFLSLPSAWNAFEVGGRRVGSTGCATLRLKVLPGPRPERLALRLFFLNSAYALWVDGKPLARSGVVGESAEQEVARPSVVLARFESAQEPLELVLQISNHHYRDAGVLASLRLGPAQAMEDAETRRSAFALLYVGALLVMGLYHLAFFRFRRSSVAMACFGAYCLLWMGNYMASDSSGWVASLLLPGVSSRVLDGFALGCFFLSVPVGYAFFRSLYPAEFSAGLLRGVGAFAAGFLAVALLAPSRVLSSALPAYYFTASLLIVYCLAMLNRARRRRRQEATFILCGFLVLGLSGLNDMLKDLQLLESPYLMPVGMFAFIASLALALARRQADSFAAVERLSEELTEKNRALGRDMEERAGLEREIVRISEAERRRLSHALHDGLCQLLTGARIRCSALEASLGQQSESAAELSALSALLEKSVGHAYDLSRGLWPAEDAHEAPSPSLEALARRFAASSGIVVECHQAKECQEAGAEPMAQLYRIAQEALTNAVKHARAHRIEVSLLPHPPGSLTLTVRDDGVGRAAPARPRGGLGLRIMAHRAGMLGGTLEVADAEGGGTVVTCTIPCPAIGPLARSGEA